MASIAPFFLNLWLNVRTIHPDTDGTESAGVISQALGMLHMGSDRRKQYLTE
jgi:hypothetical protein